MYYNEILLREIEGLYTGLLTERELAAFEEGIKAGVAERDYNHNGGILGLAKVKIKDLKK